MSLSCDVELTLGSLDLKVELDVPAGEVVAILGPNGSGKTTLLRALAGLVPLEQGRVTLSGRVLEDTGRGRRVPPAERPVGFVFQDYLLFPHLSVRENVAFGLRARGRGRSAARTEAGRWLDLMGIQPYAGDKPASLSGGQAQRAALARALAPDPELLLLDEPLSALDAGTKLEVRRELARHLGSFPGAALLVTHNPLEASALADRLVVMEQGRVVQSGTPAEIAARPRSGYVAELVGLNLLSGTAEGNAVSLAGGGSLRSREPAEGPVFVAVHPRAVALHRTRPSGSPRNVWEARVAVLDLEGDRARVSLSGDIPLVAEVTAASLAELELAASDPVWVSVKASEIEVYPA